MITTVGDFYGPGIDPPLFLFDEDEVIGGLSEFPYIYPVGNSSSWEFEFGVELVVTNVVNTGENTGQLPFDTILVFIGSGTSLLLGAVVILYIIKKSKNRKDYR